MSLYAKGSQFGTYVPSSPEQVQQADYVIDHEFATRVNPTDLGSANEAIAEFIVNEYAHLPIIAAQHVATAIHRLAPRLELANVLSSLSSNTLASEGGTWGELHQAVAMIGNKTDKPIIAVQARHAPRIAKQAWRFGLRPVLPPRLPEAFDEDSTQWRCRSSPRWAARELVGAPELRHRKQL